MLCSWELHHLYHFHSVSFKGQIVNEKRNVGLLVFKFTDLRRNESAYLWDVLLLSSSLTCREMSSKPRKKWSNTIVPLLFLCQRSC